MYLADTLSRSHPSTLEDTEMLAFVTDQEHQEGQEEVAYTIERTEEASISL